MIQVSNNHPTLQFSKEETFRIIQTVIETESASPRAISVVFVTNKYIRSINKQFLYHDYPTDVIAFPFNDDEGWDAEVYVSLDQAKSQAGKYGVSFEEEMRRLLIHSALHLARYRDDGAEEKRRMLEREEYFLSHVSSTKA